MAAPIIGPACAYGLAQTGWMPNGPRITSMGLASESTAFTFVTILAWVAWVVGYGYVCTRLIRRRPLGRAAHISTWTSIWFTIWLPAIYVTHSLYGLSSLETMSDQSRWSAILIVAALVVCLVRFIQHRRARRWKVS